MPVAKFHVVLHFDDIRLVVPQENIRMIEMIESVETYVEPEESMIGIMGWVSYFEQQYPVFTLSAELHLLDSLPASRDFCVLLETPEEAIYGLSCDQVESLEISSDMIYTDLPDCMFKAHSPIQSLMIRQNKVASMTNSQALMYYFSAWAEERMADAEALIDE